MSFCSQWESISNCRGCLEDVLFHRGKKVGSREGIKLLTSEMPPHCSSWGVVSSWSIYGCSSLERRWCITTVARPQCIVGKEAAWRTSSTDERPELITAGTLPWDVRIKIFWIFTTKKKKEPIRCFQFGDNASPSNTKTRFYAESPYFLWRKMY